MNDERIDAMLRTAMPARPEPPDATNLAARAIAMARVARRATPPTISPAVRWLTTLVAWAAAIAVLIVGYVKWSALAAWSQVAETTATAATTDLAPTLAVGGVGLLLAIVYVALAGGADEGQSSIQ